MKALSIVALLFAALSIFVPVAGISIAMLCSVLAMISFRSQPTLSGITFGINTISTAFLSPTIIMSDIMSDMSVSGNLDLGKATTIATGESGEIYWFYVGFHLVVFAIAMIWRLIRGPFKAEVDKLP